TCLHTSGLPSFPTRRSSDLWIAQGPVVHEIVVHRARLDRNAQVEASVHHLSHLIERLFEKHAADIELDLGILEPGELVQDRLHRSEEHTSELQSRFDLVCRL